MDAVSFLGALGMSKWMGECFLLGRVSCSDAGRLRWIWEGARGVPDDFCQRKIFNLSLTQLKEPEPHPPPISKKQQQQQQQKNTYNISTSNGMIHK